MERLTESEATAWLKYMKGRKLPYDRVENRRRLAYSVAISALEEIQQYRAIGTVSEFRELKEKATAKKAVLKKGVYHCPSCEMAYAVVTQGYCTFCGQHMN